MDILSYTSKCRFCCVDYKQLCLEKCNFTIISAPVLFRQAFKLFILYYMLQANCEISHFVEWQKIPSISQNGMCYGYMSIKKVT